MYTWGWDTNGELGLVNRESKVVAVPTLVDFVNDQDEGVEVLVKKVQCGNTFTICMTGMYFLFWKAIEGKNIFQDCTFSTDDGTLWGCGCNKYGQLGQSPDNLLNSPKFVKLEVSFDSSAIKDFKCREWGTVITTD